jgi:phosphohistidine phosphatase
VKRLYLLRHAKSSWDDPELSDHDRPLAKRGRRASKLIAEHLGRERIRPALILCSSARRTRETLDRIAPAMGAKREVRIERELYRADAMDLLGLLRGLPDDVGSVMLIGHNPAIQDLGLALAGRGPVVGMMQEKFPTGALATLEFDGPWRELAPGAGSAVAFIKPRELEQ